MLRRGHRVTILTFYPGGPFVEPLIATGAEVVPVGKRGRWDLIRFLARLSRELRRRRPDILYSFLPIANVIASTARLVFPRIPIVWGVRASNLDTTRYDRLSRLSYLLERRLARFANLIIANSSAGAAHAIAQGYPKARLRVVANGIDTDRFCRDAIAGAALRAEWGIGPSLRLVGMVGRLDPMKGVPNFLRAAAELARNDETVRFAVIGEGAEPYRTELRQLAAALDLAERMTWSPARADITAIYSALDLLVSSSAFGEGFPNVVAEAMACGTPVVATAVGDSAIVVGPWGTIVPPENSSALAAAMRRQLDRSASERDQMTAAARQHIERSFSVAAMVQHTEELLLPLLPSPNLRSDRRSSHGSH
jgi:glycosyltransferase involved in cell wall biosynthesis